MNRRTQEPARAAHSQRVPDVPRPCRTSGSGWPDPGPAGFSSGHAWAALAGVLAGGALLAWWLPTVLIDWQPGLAWRQPWRAWTAAWVHWSPLHLGANLAGTLAVAAFGLAAQLPARAAVAWFVAWPLTQWGLLAKPELAHYGGLSGVLHAGAAGAAVWLALARRGRQRLVGIAVLAVMAAKLVHEEPWGAALRHSSGWDIALAPIAHATGALAGLLCAAAVWALSPRHVRLVGKNPRT